MRRKIILTAVVGAAIVFSLAAGRLAARLWVSAQDGSHRQSPALVLSTTERDFGNVTQGRRLRARFPIQNRGARRLIVSRYIKPCCGKPGSRQDLVIGAGQMRFVQIEVDTSLWIGSVVRTIQYKTNDVRRPNIELTIRATVRSSNASETAGQSQIPLQPVSRHTDVLNPKSPE